MKLFVGYVHGDEIPHVFMEALIGQMFDQANRTTITAKASGPLICRARNDLVSQFLETDCDAFLSVDTDIVWKPEQVSQLVSHHKDIVGGIYYSRNDDGSPFSVGFSGQDEDGAYLSLPADLEDRGLMEVAALGMGFTLISRPVLEALGAGVLWPFAETEDRGRGRGEDVTFCERARDKGYSVWLDPKVRVGHFKGMLL